MVVLHWFSVLAFLVSSSVEQGAVLVTKKTKKKKKATYRPDNPPLHLIDLWISCTASLMCWASSLIIGVEQGTVLATKKNEKGVSVLTNLLLTKASGWSTLMAVGLPRAWCGARDGAPHCHRLLVGRGEGESSCFASRCCHPRWHLMKKPKFAVYFFFFFIFFFINARLKPNPHQDSHNSCVPHFPACFPPQCDHQPPGAHRPVQLRPARPAAGGARRGTKPLLPGHHQADLLETPDVSLR